MENFPDENAGYQYRAKKWSHIFNKNGYHWEVHTCATLEFDFFRDWSSDEYFKFYVKSIAMKFRHCLYARNFETVIVRRELLIFNDYGNLFMEKFLLKIHQNVILDFDDDIAASKNQPKKVKSLFGKMLLEDGNKFNNSLRIYKRFIVASEYLKQKVLKENQEVSPDNILVVPTCVDYDKYAPKNYDNLSRKLSFGWIGGDHNYPLLDSLIPVLNKLANDFEFKLIVIGGQKYKREVNFEIEFLNWSLETEVECLYKIDIGLMPLNDDAKSKGKGGFKLIQYMGLGIVSVASAITINTEIVEDGHNSFLVNSNEEWYEKLRTILERKIDFKSISIMARKQIMENYSFKANQKKYIEFVSKHQITNHKSISHQS